jgi:hypothetical protein
MMQIFLKNLPMFYPNTSFAYPKAYATAYFIYIMGFARLNNDISYTHGVIKAGFALF